MEEKKFDINSIVGFVLIGAILMWVLYTNKPTEEELQAEKAKQEQVEKEKAKVLEDNAVDSSVAETTIPQDSAALANYKDALGAFGYSAALPSAKDDITTLANELIELKINNKGGQIVEAKMKNFTTYDSIPVYLVKDGNAAFNLSFSTTDNRNLNTQDLFFEPRLTKNGENQVLSMKLKVSNDKYLEYRYELKPDDYMVDFTIRSQGLSGVVNTSQPVTLDWNLKTIRHSKSITYENRYTRLTYKHEDDKTSKLSPTGNDDETIEDAKWLAYRHHFFMATLVSSVPFKTAHITSEDLVEEESAEAKFTKAYTTSIPLEWQGGEINQNLNWYYGPTDFKILKEYKDVELADAVPFGWGIFGVINKYVFTPLYDVLSSFLPYGVAIIVMTILVRLLMSPITYKSYLSQAKMKVIRPEMNEINEKYKDQPMKKQQETMKLYGKAGVNPMSGCIPALMQLPIFYALFMFFPTAFMLRQKSFLWAEDLSSYDTIAKLPFKIPFYGDHVSLFPILASVAIFFYMRMTTGQQQMMQQPTQEGMPDMGKMMKVMIYISPLLMLFFFNNYASGLSLYYFISNLITIFIMLFIKKYVIDEDKIHAKIQENKKKPKKESKFQRKMREMMEQAEAQKNAKK
ncbi:YidC/Oxa1 family membrane protein insertase [Zhouia amylolytica]|uniref:Membrane protein insertase YidC n=2 Tax=Zhouia amylolytica TaxID=376730 RepID=W2UUJ1_9FLAO|nr:membrane protein insertase YidC [Zhouia amylolytica]ETN97032.1 membrane protein insertase, YidC/Oxa1 family, N-terminal domain protein [Zhouia amylolytica AD3]MCQ0110126.1 membrane protein insertase YidC [Zhouia amylolytica]SFT06939.1 YidC/Oxa1 family membrane protein insertase [Zhouia amylolytica]